jgi:hypothetical protein
VPERSSLVTEMLQTLPPTTARTNHSDIQIHTHTHTHTQAALTNQNQKKKKEHTLILRSLAYKEMKG